ncbi:helix-turn-helix transcriptional regulator [Heyndrickxia sporothermodurans]|uniref:helix-turn-helix transcriptional regulator n=1 Tax=Heyndrickxia sporothermodurans TaxID=46224 RepID=UPI002E20EF00|nr:helix-turn-helix transcriptional regulator [Heyndrickxia sporothermodurans]
MQEIEFQLRGKVIRLARLMKNCRPRDFAKMASVDADYLSKIEREVRSMSRLNEIRLLRALRELGVTDAQLAALQIIVEHDEGKFDE